MPVAGLFDDITNYFDESYEWAKEKLGESYDETMSKIKKLQRNLDELEEIQDEVDYKISLLPEGALKARLMSQRNESRDWVDTYVIPAWSKVKGYLNSSDAEFDTMGAVPVIGLAAVTSALSVGLYWVHRSMENEEKILNDPELKKVYAKAKASRGLLGNMPQYVLWIGAAGIILYGINTLRK